jgi:hypothetical protein
LGSHAGVDVVVERVDLDVAQHAERRGVRRHQRTVGVAPVGLELLERKVRRPPQEKDKSDHVDAPSE